MAHGTWFMAHLPPRSPSRSLARWHTQINLGEQTGDADKRDRGHEGETKP